ncbi:hypothetical protein GOODEAATRI_010952 [Goodea atripinnis]|uniref:Uncharacterized protein n=1 Tax=Goodea atripinnis TaxID=208336 RepID=A0ABV0P3A0_9TELE
MECACSPCACVGSHRVPRLPPTAKNMTVRLTGLSKLPLGVSAWLFVLYVSVLPCNGLATSPGCTLPLARGPLEIGTSSPVTHYGISGTEDEVISNHMLNILS